MLLSAKRPADYLAQAKKTRYAEILSEVAESNVETIAEVDYIWSDWILGFDHPRAIEMDEMTLDTHLALKILRAMEQTEEDLLIVSPYFVPGEEFTRIPYRAGGKGCARAYTHQLPAGQ